MWTSIVATKAIFRSKWAKKMSKISPGAPLTIITEFKPSFMALSDFILNGIFDNLDAPSTVRLALTGPYFLQKLVEYHEIDEYRDLPGYRLRFELPPGIPYWDSAAHGVALRYMCMTVISDGVGGNTLIWDGLSVIEDEMDAGISSFAWEKTEMGSDIVEITSIVSTWMERFGYDKKGTALCCECARFIVGKNNPKESWLTMDPRVVVCGNCRTKFPKLRRLLTRRQVFELYE